MISLKLLVVILGMAFAFPEPDSKAISQRTPPPVVTTLLGKIEGAILVTRLGKPIYAFRGIRYAKAPIDELRFQPPEPVESWEGVLNATQDGPACPQWEINTPTSEDCLLLNVYTTKLPKGTENPKRPVLVFLHGGGFYSGSADSTNLGPKYLLDKDIVLVTPNYRLGSLGFLSTGDKEAPGNNGFKDQVEALKWVKENIGAFGGDPESVTLGGYSAGAAAVSLHLVSPLSQGLFNRAIVMGASIFGNWPLQTDQLQLAKKQAELVGCATENVSNMIKCLRKTSAEDLGKSIPKFREFGKNDPILIWLPVIEPDFGQKRFLTVHPLETVYSGKFSKVPVLTGVTTDEFAKFAFDVIYNPKLLQDINSDFERIAPIAFLYERGTDNSKLISKELKKFYFLDKPLDNSSLGALAQLYSDAIVGFAVNRVAKVFAEKSTEPVFYYKFNFKGKYSNYYMPESNNTVPYGVVHGDDLIYLFQSYRFPDFSENDLETQTIEKLTELWCNFICTGKPIPETSEKLDNVKWEPFSAKTKKYMDIGNKLIVGENLYEKRYGEWDKLFPVSKYQSNKAG